MKVNKIVKRKSIKQKKKKDKHQELYPVQLHAIVEGVNGTRMSG